MSKKNDRIVYKTKDGDWANKKNSADKASSLHSTQKAAEEAARIMLKSQGGGELTTKSLDGKIRSKESIRVPTSYHVYRDAHGKWCVKKSGSVKAIKSFEAREDSIEFAKKLSKEENNDLVIHSIDGRIKSKESYSGSPNPPKDQQ